MKQLTIREKQNLKHRIRRLNQELWDQTLANLDHDELYPLSPEEHEMAGKEYLRLMRNLATNVLEDILVCHDEGLSIRNPNTIQEVLSELVDRAFMR